MWATLIRFVGTPSVSLQRTPSHRFALYDCPRPRCGMGVWDVGEPCAIAVLSSVFPRTVTPVAAGFLLVEGSASAHSPFYYAPGNSIVLASSHGESMSIRAGVPTIFDGKDFVIFVRPKVCRFLAFETARGRVLWTVLVNLSMILFKPGTQEEASRRCVFLTPATVCGW